MCVASASAALGLAADAVPPRSTSVMVIGRGPFSVETATARSVAISLADVVLYEDGIDPAILALVPPGAFVEPVAAAGGPLYAGDCGIARAGKLAGEGWRVVWLAAGDPRPVELALAAAGVADVESDGLKEAAEVPYRPHLLATALNGLAG